MTITHQQVCDNCGDSEEVTSYDIKDGYSPWEVCQWCDLRLCDDCLSSPAHKCIEVAP
jgi:hypothetical protein